MSLRARLLLVLAALTIVGLLVVNVVTQAALKSFLLDRVDRSLAGNVSALHDRKMGFIDRRDLEQLAESTPGIYIEFRDVKGNVYSEVLGREDDAPVPELPAVVPDDGSTFTVGARGDGPDFRVRAESVGWMGNTLILAAPLDDVSATLQRLTVIMVVVSAAVLAGIVALGLWLVRVGLRPLGRIEKTAAAIAGGDLGRRIDTAPATTEVGRLGRALNAMLGQIEAAFAQRAASERRLRRFVADASHELRTPLSAVQAYAELFDRGARDRPDDLERAMAGIGRESRRMGDLVDELLLLARLDQGRPLERVPVDLAEVAREAVDAARALDPDRPLAVEGPDDLAVIGDPDRLRQVVDNLLANVRAHTPAGAPATVRVAREGDRAVIEVSDSGPGLSEEQAARVFERFYRADPSRARDGAGSGLGLSIVAAIAEAHGGRASVAARSAPARGATFRVELPLAEPLDAEGAGRPAGERTGRPLSPSR